MEHAKPAGFLGLGIMGLAMARNARNAGFEVLAWNRGRPRRELARAEGIPLAASPREVAARCDPVVVMVTGPEAVEELLRGPRGILAADVRGRTLLQMSTLDVTSTLRLARRADAHGMAFLDCPVSGSRAQAESAQLVVLAGGDTALLEKWERLLLALGKAVVRAGDVGAGTALKLAVNLIVAQMATALGESVALAEAHGLDPSLLFDVLAMNPALDAGFWRAKRASLLAREYPPAFSLGNIYKDVRFMERAARGHGVRLPVTGAVRRLMAETVNARREAASRDLMVLSETVRPRRGGTPRRRRGRG